MFTIKKLKKSPNPTKRIKAGTYHATVTAVFDDEKYVAGDAFVLMYTLQCPDGTDAGEFRETFFNLKANTRTKELVALVEKLGNETEKAVPRRHKTASFGTVFVGIKLAVCDMSCISCCFLCRLW
jgi:hypothetical protein